MNAQGGVRGGLVSVGPRSVELLRRLLCEDRIRLGGSRSRGCGCGVVWYDVGGAWVVNGNRTWEWLAKAMR